MTPLPPCRPAFPSGPYALTDRRLAGGRSHEHIVESLLAGGIRLIQIREKLIRGTPDADRLLRESHPSVAPLTRDELRDSIRRCLALARAAGAALFVNDDPELAAETGADGVHVGQDDCPPRRARELLGPDRIIGFSTHTREQFLAALEEPIDYVAIGPVFGTTSKESPYAALGLDFVRWAVGEARRRGLPLVAIGGISPDNLPALVRAAPDCRPAAIGALMTPGDITAAARRFLAVLHNALFTGPQ